MLRQLVIRFPRTAKVLRVAARTAAVGAGLFLATEAVADALSTTPQPAEKPKPKYTPLEWRTANHISWWANEKFPRLGSREWPEDMDWRRADIVTATFGDCHKSLLEMMEKYKVKLIGSTLINTAMFYPFKVHDLDLCVPDRNTSTVMEFYFRYAHGYTVANPRKETYWSGLVGLDYVQLLPPKGSSLPPVDIIVSDLTKDTNWKLTQFQCNVFDGATGTVRIQYPGPTMRLTSAWFHPKGNDARDAYAALTKWQKRGAVVTLTPEQQEMQKKFATDVVVMSA